MAVITKIKLKNFKRFRNFMVELDPSINVFVGDNEAGKSTILSAIDIVLSGSKTKIENIGLDNLFNNESIQEFMQGTREYACLPELIVELYLDEQNNPILNGKINSEDVTCDGLRLICEPNEDLSKEIKEILGEKTYNFPFEYYSINFYTFSKDGYTGRRKFLRHILIDSTQISSEYATRDFVQTMYGGYLQDAEKSKHKNEYRKYKTKFKDEVLSDVNNRLEDKKYAFGLQTGARADLEMDLTISYNDVNIVNKGKGTQCFIKTEFALNKKKIRNKDLNLVLVEEPENHLSHVNMNKLIDSIINAKDRQLLISTHNSLICSRLGLRNAILLNSSTTKYATLKQLPEDTAKYFIKSPNNNILEFILSPKVILVEGNAEYILLDAFFEKVAGESLEKSDVHIISVGGTSFKRYLDLAKILGIKTAVVRDNDKDYQANCVDNYSNYQEEYIKIFSDISSARYTFEVALYEDNKEICDQVFQGARRSLAPLDYMLKNKAESAFVLLDRYIKEIVPPSYIVEAIEWIRK